MRGEQAAHLLHQRNLVRLQRASDAIHSALQQRGAPGEGGRE